MLLVISFYYALISMQECQENDVWGSVPRYKCTKEIVLILCCPSNKQEKSRRVNAFPNNIAKVTKYMDVREKHWQHGYKKTKK